MKILLDSSSKPPAFHFSDDAGDPVKLIEVRITEVGESNPSWWLVHDDGWIEDAVKMHILTPEEAERAEIAVSDILFAEPGIVANAFPR